MISTLQLMPLPPSGVMDLLSLAAANVLVGNAPMAAGHKSLSGRNSLTNSKASFVLPVPVPVHGLSPRSCYPASLPDTLPGLN
jgi:hypothetical protein